MKTIDYIGIKVSKKTLQIDAASLAPSCPNQAKALAAWFRQLPARAHLVVACARKLLTKVCSQLNNH